MIPLPKSFKRRVRSLVNLPVYGPVGLHDPQQLAEVWLEGLGEPRNITGNNVVVALRPFTIGVMLDHPASDIPHLRLSMRERSPSSRLLGVLHLRPAGGIPFSGRCFCFFETPRCENYCVSPLRLRAYYLRERWRAELRQRRNRYNFLMTYPDIRCSHVFYICPRPVVLVTVEHQGASNMFPMDLIGPVDSPCFSMTLRLTSPAVKLMQQSRRMALASVPFPYKAHAYELGKHHKLTTVDWAGLPFPTRPSPLFGLPVAEAALRVREVCVEECHEVGSHMLFLTAIARDTLPDRKPEGTDGLQLFHTFSSYRQLLSMEEA